MGMVKEKYTEYLVNVERVEEACKFMTRYGVKSHKDSNGEWVETRCSRMGNFFDDEFEVYPHLTE